MRVADDDDIVRAVEEDSRSGSINLESSDFRSEVMYRIDDSGFKERRISKVVME